MSATTTTTRDRGDRYGPMEWGPWNGPNKTFYDDTAKSAYHAKYLRMSWTYIDILYRFGRRIGEDDYQNIVWWSPKGRCYGNQLNLGDVRRNLQERPKFTWQ